MLNVMQHARFPQQLRIRKRSGVTFLPEAAGCFQCFPFEFRRDPFLEYKICAHHQFVGDVTGVSSTAVSGNSPPNIWVSVRAIGVTEEALGSLDKGNSMASAGTTSGCGCWTVTLVRRCGYEKR